MPKDENTIKEFKILVVKHSKKTTETHLLELIAKHKDKKLAYVLIFYFLMVNWSSVKDIKDSAEKLSKLEGFSTTNHSEVFNDRCKLNSGCPYLLLQ